MRILAHPPRSAVRVHLGSIWAPAHAPGLCHGLCSPPPRGRRAQCGAAALLRPPVTAPRRAVLSGGVALVAGRRRAAATAYPPGFEPSRVEGIGGGADVLSDRPPAVPDVYYPPSLIGLWQCQRQVVSVEGDAQQAEGSWRLLGGDGALVRIDSLRGRRLLGVYHVAAA